MAESSQLRQEFRRVKQWSQPARGPQFADSFEVAFSFDGGGLPLVLPQYSPPFEIPASCRVVGCRIWVGIVDSLAGNTCSATFNVSRGTFTDYPSLTLLHDQATPPTLTNGLKADVTNTTTWTTTQLLARDGLVAQIVTLSGFIANPIQITLGLLLRKIPSLVIGLQDGAGNIITDAAGNPVIGAN